MKVLLLNGSPNKKGCTYTALRHVAQELETADIETEITWIGNKPIRGCSSCGKCGQIDTHRCVFDDDVTNSIIDKAVKADGLVVGSPVFFAGANGALLSVLDRMFFAASSQLSFKPAAGIANARRAGTTPTIDQINKYFHFSHMPVVSSNYWPMTHGTSPEEVEQDAEGLQIMRVLGRNMTWILRCIEASKLAGIDLPIVDPKMFTSFIR